MTRLCLVLKQMSGITIFLNLLSLADDETRTLGYQRTPHTDDLLTIS